MSATQLLGHWRNTDPESKGIAEVRVEPDPAGIRVGLRVRTREGDREWPSAPCELYDCIEEDRAPGAAALGMVVLDGLEVELQLRVNKGILCVMTWTRFLDGNRHDYVVRELFARVDTHPLLGTWHNSDASTKGVTTLVFERGPALAVRAFAAAGPGGGARGSRDIDQIVQRACEARWCLLIDEELHVEPGDEFSHQQRRGQPDESYCTYYAVDYMASLFPDAKVHPPVNPEWQHCCLSRKTASFGRRFWVCHSPCCRISCSYSFT